MSDSVPHQKQIVNSKFERQKLLMSDVLNELNKTIVNKSVINIPYALQPWEAVGSGTEFLQF